MGDIILMGEKKLLRIHNFKKSHHPFVCSWSWLLATETDLGNLSRREFWGRVQILLRMTRLRMSKNHGNSGGLNHCCLRCMIDNHLYIIVSFPQDSKSQESISDWQSPSHVIYPGYIRAVLSSVDIICSHDYTQ